MIVFWDFGMGQMNYMYSGMYGFGMQMVMNVVMYDYVVVGVLFMVVLLVMVVVGLWWVISGCVENLGKVFICYVVVIEFFVIWFFGFVDFVMVFGMVWMSIGLLFFVIFFMVYFYF